MVEVVTAAVTETVGMEEGSWVEAAGKDMATETAEME